MNALVLIVDGWHCGFAGPWGNTWLPTPALNRWAAESFVFDQAHLDTPDVAALCRSQLSGCSDANATGPSIAERAASTGIHTLLLTDDPQISGHPLAQDFSECRLLSAPLPTRPASSVADTHLARFFAAAIEQLDSLESPFLAWLHTSSLRLVWDAPLELRNSFVDDEEEESLPPQGVDVPNRRLPDDFDPDERLGERRAYAGQILVLDECLAALGAALASRIDATLLILAGARGFPLGEHGWLGLGPGRPLHEELIHFPLLIRMPSAESVGRSNALVQPADLAATLAEWFRLESPTHEDARSLLPLVRGEPQPPRASIKVGSPDGQSALRTAQWLLVRPHGAEPQLFVKPDDRWERNDVANRCHDVVDELSRE